MLHLPSRPRRAAKEQRERAFSGVRRGVATVRAPGTTPDRFPRGAGMPSRTSEKSGVLCTRTLRRARGASAAAAAEEEAPARAAAARGAHGAGAGRLEQEVLASSSPLAAARRAGAPRPRIASVSGGGPPQQERGKSGRGQHAIECLGARAGEAQLGG